MDPDTPMTQDLNGLNKIAPDPIQLADGELSHDHTGASSHITDVLVGESHRILGDSSGLYLVWPIRIVVDEATHSLISLYKRYSDIEAFRAAVVREFPDEGIPPLPPKDSFLVERLCLLELWLERRRKGIQWFLSNVLLNPRFQHSEVITQFVLS